MSDTTEKQTRRKVSAIKSDNLSKPGKPRFVIVDAETGEVLDDAQGYGYKTAQGAHAAWGYKTRDKSKDAAKKAKTRRIQKWMREHKNFVDAMDEYAFE